MNNGGKAKQRTSSAHFHRALGMVVLLCIGGVAQAARDVSLVETIATAQPKMVKIHGAGGFRGLEAYQSGFVISADGHVLTVWSYVLDTDFITVTLDDGRKFQAELVGSDPRLEIAVLKIDATELPYYQIEKAVELPLGAQVLAFSNLYGVATGDEPSSVLKGIVSARVKLDARRGAFKTPYRGPVYVVDAMTNNPGAAGGALTNYRGELAGLIGKELRNSQNNTWLNYAIPVDQLTAAVDDIIAGRIRPLTEEDIERPAEPLSLDLLGLVLVPDVLSKTPPFVDRVLPDSPAFEAGIRPDDLVLFLNDRVVPSCRGLRDALGLIDRGEEINVLIQRDQELMEFRLRAKF